MKRIDRMFLLIVLLSLVGIATSIYLVFEHYQEEGATCDVNETISCSLTNASVYSEFLNVPVAIFGITWFIFFLPLVWKRKRLSMLFWTILGFLSCLYFIGAEIMLKNICPYCTVVHIIVTLFLIYAIWLYKTSEKMYWKQELKSIKLLLVLVIIINLLPFLVFNMPEQKKINLDDIAKCISNEDISVYSVLNCRHCERTKEMFGDSFQYINNVECQPDAQDSQTKLCIDKKIEGTPTWIKEVNGNEVERKLGFMTIEELLEFSGCKS